VGIGSLVEGEYIGSGRDKEFFKRAKVKALFPSTVPDLLIPLAARYNSV
jgi:hypothetical protein